MKQSIYNIGYLFFVYVEVLHHRFFHNFYRNKLLIFPPHFHYTIYLIWWLKQYTPFHTENPWGGKTQLNSGVFLSFWS